MSEYKGGNKVTWDYFDKFSRVLRRYMPDCGEGETMASQIATAVNKLIYKWFNDGDVFDNTYSLEGWWNDLSSYANWLNRYVYKAVAVLEWIEKAYTHDDYELLLKELADRLLNEETLAEYATKEKVGSIYDCDGPYKFKEEEEEEWDDDGYIPEDEEDDE